MATYMAKKKSDTDSASKPAGNTGGTVQRTKLDNSLNRAGTSKTESTRGENAVERRDISQAPRSSGGSGLTRNSSNTVKNAINTVNVATGITNGYKPTGTYNDADLRASGNGMIDPITRYKIQYETAKARGDQAGMDQAHQGAEAYRSQFGYSGGDDGSENIRLAAPVTAQQAAPQWQMPEAYQYTPFEQSDIGRYALDEYQGLLNKLQSYQPFSYNPEEDPLYQQYADSYIRSGQRASSDILGQLAARTGGMASSYAGAMAQQGYDQYMQELAAKVPELRQIAYNMYADDYNRQLGLYDRGYQRFMDDYNRYFDQSKFDYGLYNDRTNLEYQAYRDQVADQQWRDQFDWTKSTDARDYARNVFTSDRAYDRDVLTSDRDYEANRADTKWNQDFSQAQFDYQKEQAEREYNLSQKSELYNRVANGYMPTDEDAVRYGISQAELASLRQWVKNQWGAQSDKWWAYR